MLTLAVTPNVRPNPVTLAFRAAPAVIVTVVVMPHLYPNPSGKQTLPVRYPGLEYLPLVRGEVTAVRLVRLGGTGTCPGAGQTPIKTANTTASFVLIMLVSSSCDSQSESLRRAFATTTTSAEDEPRSRRAQSFPSSSSRSRTPHGTSERNSASAM